MTSVPSTSQIQIDFAKVANSSLLWLADAPLFIDGPQVEQLYDAIARPEGEEGPTTLTVSKSQANEVGRKIGAELEAEPGFIASLVSSMFSFKVKGTIEGSTTGSDSKEEAKALELRPIKTPQRQLIQLTAHFLLRFPERLYWNGQDDWQEPAAATQMPRGLVFLDLPSLVEAEKYGRAETMLMPIAAEYTNGKTVLMYERLIRKNGMRPPEYPDRERDESLEDLQKRQAQYWDFFKKGFSSRQCLELIESCGSKHGRLQWINYRLPLNKDRSKPVHLNLRPAGAYDTGTFGYNLVRRGHKQGLRLVGTLRSGLSLNVLAVFEK